MLALAANLLGTKIGIATMAHAMDALTNFLADQVLSAPPARNGDTIRDIALTFLIARGNSRPSGDLLFALVLRLLERVSGTVLASLVTALQANFVGTVRGVALVATAVDSHADILLDTLGLRRRRKLQVG